MCSQNISIFATWPVKLQISKYSGIWTLQRSRIFVCRSRKIPGCIIAVIIRYSADTADIGFVFSVAIDYKVCTDIAILVVGQNMKPKSRHHTQLCLISYIDAYLHTLASTKTFVILYTSNCNLWASFGIWPRSSLGEHTKHNKLLEHHHATDSITPWYLANHTGSRIWC